MAHVPDSTSPAPADDGLPRIDHYPNDVAITSIWDARRRLALADAVEDDLLQQVHELERLQREALETAGMFDVEATLDPKQLRALLAKVPAPETWGDAWMIDLIDPGAIYDSDRQVQALRRVAAYAGIPSTEVREVIDAIGAAMSAVLDSRGRELLPRSADVIGQLGSARGDYLHLRDAIAGRLDRMEAEQSSTERKTVTGGHPVSGHAARGVVDFQEVPGRHPAAPPPNPGQKTGSTMAANENLEQPDGPHPAQVLQPRSEDSPVGAPPDEPADPDDSQGPPVWGIQRLDRPDGFSEERWEELASLRSLLGVCDRYLNRVLPNGRRSTGLFLATGVEREIIGLLNIAPGQAALRLHHKARDLAGNLRHHCAGIQLPECPPVPPGLADGPYALVHLAVRDAVPALRDWVARVERVVREWAQSHLAEGSEARVKSPRARKRALEDRTDPESLLVVSLYDRLIAERRAGESPARRASRLSADKDLVDLARQAHSPRGVTEALVKKADQFARDRAARRERREADGQK
jgi:hypothetical protein